MQMYEFATGAWLFCPEDASETDALRHRLTQITQRTSETIPQHVLEASPYIKNWNDLNARCESVLSLWSLLCRYQTVTPNRGKYLTFDCIASLGERIRPFHINHEGLPSSQSGGETYR